MCCFPNQKIGGHPFSQSYGVILPSSFDMVLSNALVYSTCSPVLAWGTGSTLYYLATLTLIKRLKVLIKDRSPNWTRVSPFEALLTLQKAAFKVSSLR
nr:reverse transcriptase zinc-binding domain-containing protein [Ipomoea batatas]